MVTYMIKYIIIIISIIALNTASAQSSCQRNYKMKDLKKTYLTEADNPIGSAIIIHGLNNRVDNMDKIAKEFRKLRYTTIHVALHGHRGKFEESKYTTYRHWEKDFDYAYCLAKEYNKKMNIDPKKIILMGFSLGAQISYNKLLKSQSKLIQNHIYFAPAIKVRSYINVLSLFQYFPQSWFTLSRNYKEYIADRKASFAIYSSTWDGLKKINENHKKLTNKRFFIAMDPKDGLVDHQSLMTEIKSRAPLETRFFKIDSQAGELNSPSNHLILDTNTLGQEQWKKLFSAIKDFLNE